MIPRRLLTLYASDEHETARLTAAERQALRRPTPVGDCRAFKTPGVLEAFGTDYIRHLPPALVPSPSGFKVGPAAGSGSGLSAFRTRRDVR